eukprot:TRINITY_DN9964_c0_g1_i1.p2 TRINITY_DN9964_c0_g1~~TRINITY_DN9964_c0_g1_i1.p2  ORF type:complete len:102 (-),score=27.22 TRINITY_DN9964_c0_g1_i1:258-563(-)
MLFFSVCDELFQLNRDPVVSRVGFFLFFCFFFSSRRRHTRCREVSWARRCVQETDCGVSAGLRPTGRKALEVDHLRWRHATSPGQAGQEGPAGVEEKIFQF